MKRGLIIVLVILVFTGCAGRDIQTQPMTQLRENLLKMDHCTFQAVIRADYGEVSYEFSTTCSYDRDGNLSFTVMKPETIAGVCGNVRPQGGQLTFDDAVLGFPLLADGEVSPVSAPWILMRTLVGGYISSWVTEGEHLHVILDDSYEDDALQVDVWLDANAMPCYAELVWQGRRVLSIRVESFEIV